MKISIQSDQYFNNKSKYDSIYGDMVQPVDMNGGLIHGKVDRYSCDPKGLDVVEDNIQERFGLKEPNEDY